MRCRGASGDLSTAESATGIVDAVADQLVLRSEIRISDEDEPDVPPSIVSESLVSGMTNAVTYIFSAVDCRDSSDAEMPCITDEDFDASGAVVNISYIWSDTDVTSIGSNEVVNNVSFERTIDFDNGRSTSATDIVIIPVLAEDVDQAMIGLDFFTSDPSGGDDISGIGNLILVPGGPDFNADLSGNEVLNFNDVVILVQSIFTGSYAGRIAGFEDEVNAPTGNLGATPVEREAELDRRFQALLESATR